MSYIYYLGNADEIDDLSKEVGDNAADIKDNGNDVKQNIKDIKKNKNDVKGNWIRWLKYLQGQNLISTINLRL